MGHDARRRLLCTVGLFLIALLPLGAQPSTVLDGVYTSAQAKRGEAAYLANCASCHKQDLTGFSGPPLKDDVFLDRWREFRLSVLFDLIRTSMPLGAAGSLPENVYLDVLAHLLEKNSIPAGSKEPTAELTAEITRSTLLVGKDGPKPLPSSTPVETAGCLTLDVGNGWFLTMANPPARTLNQWELTAEELKAARAKPLGDQLFRLQNITEIEGLDALVGNKVDVKGLLVLQPNNARINVTAAQKLAAGCEP